MTDIDIHDINYGICVYCEAPPGVACLKEGCRNVRCPELNFLQSKLAAYKSQVSRMVEPKNPKHRYFEMDEEMQEQARTWLTEHKKTCKVHRPGAYHGAIGGTISYTFTGTSIGMLCTIECACGEKSDCSGTL